MRSQKEQPKFQAIENPDILDVIHKELPCVGVLEQMDDHYVYAKVSDDFITKLYPLIENLGAQIPDYLTNPHQPGAHISVIFPEEIKIRINQKDLGRPIAFSTGNLLRAEIFGRTYFVIEVFSKDLEDLRKKYHLRSDRITFRGFLAPFHITIGIIETSIGAERA